MVNKHTLCVANVAVKPLGCWCLCSQAHVQVQCEETEPQYLFLQVPFWFPGRSLGESRVPGRARGPPSESLPRPQQLRGTLRGTGPSSRGSHTTAEAELILSLILHASSEHSCFSGLENPGFPSPYLDNS